MKTLTLTEYRALQAQDPASTLMDARPCPVCLGVWAQRATCTACDAVGRIRVVEDHDAVVLATYCEVRLATELAWGSRAATPGVQALRARVTARYEAALALLEEST